MEEQIFGISKQQIKALKNGNTIVFCYSDGKHIIQSIKTESNSSTGFRETVTMDVTGILYDYDKYETNKEIRYCYEIDLFNGMILQTIWKNLKENDLIVICWSMNNNSDVMKERDIVCDSLHLKIKRDGVYVSEFIISNHITTTNSSSRMIRYYR